MLIQEQDNLYCFTPVKKNLSTLLNTTIFSLSSKRDNDKEKIMNIFRCQDEFHPLTNALKNINVYNSNDKRTSDQISDKEKKENQRALSIVYILINIFDCEGQELVDEVKESHRYYQVSRWLNLSDLHFCSKGGSFWKGSSNGENKLIHKKRNFKYILDNFEECTGESLASPPDYRRKYNQRAQLRYITKVFEEYIERELTHDEFVEFHKKVIKINKKNEKMTKEKTLMSYETRERWYKWLEYIGYEEHDNYSLEKQIKIWNYFNQ